MRLFAKLRRRMPGGFLGMIGLVLVVEGLIAGLQLDLMDPYHLTWWMAGRAATHQARQSQVLCLGTSMVQCGILPRLIERRAGLATYNLGTAAGLIPAEYYLLRRALRAGAKPSVVVVDLNPCLLAEDYHYYHYPGFVNLWTYVLGPSDCLDMAWTVGDPAFLARTLLTSGIPSVRFRPQLREAVLGALEGRAWSRRKLNLTGIRNLNQNDGTLVQDRNPNYGGEISPWAEFQYLKSDGPWDRWNIEYLRRMYRLCNQYGVRLYGLSMPMAPALLTRRRELGNDAAFVQRVRRLQDLAPSLVIVDARNSNYQPSAFLDAVHLGPDGTLVFSDDLGKLLSQENETSQKALWVDLPRFQQRRVDCWIETLSASGIAVGPNTAVRR